MYYHVPETGNICTSKVFLGLPVHESIFVTLRSFDFSLLTFACPLMFQSDTASVEIPELELELSAGTLGGLVTTVEGLLTNICESKLLLTI